MHLVYPGDVLHQLAAGSRFDIFQEFNRFVIEHNHCHFLADDRLHPTSPYLFNLFRRQWNAPLHIVSSHKFTEPLSFVSDSSHSDRNYTSQWSYPLHSKVRIESCLSC